MFLPRNRRRGHNAQLQGTVFLDRDNPLTDKLLLASYMRGEDAYHEPPLNYVTGKRGSIGDSVSLSFSDKGVSAFFDGTPQSKATVPVDLGTNRIITVSYLSYADSYVTNMNALAFGGDVFTNNGFLIIPNWSSFGSLYFFAGVGSPGTKYAGAWGTRQALGVWNYYQFIFNRDDTVFGTDGCYENGVAVLNNSTNLSYAASDFGVGDLSIMSYNNGATQRMPGKIQCLTIHAGALTGLERTSMLLNPWQLVKPVERPMHPVRPAVPPQPMLWQSP